MRVQCTAYRAKMWQSNQTRSQNFTLGGVTEAARGALFLPKVDDLF